MLVNVIAAIVFVVHFISFVLNMLNQEEPESTIESLYFCILIIAFLCSMCTVVFFVLIFNFNGKMLQKKKTNYIILLITMLGLYIPILQLFQFKDFLLTSCVLLIFDSYTLQAILNNLISKSNKN